MSAADGLVRKKMLEQLGPGKSWDILVIGGGATGLGIALDAASRGYSTLLLEQNDFAKATSSRSTKLVHGGVRYLAQGNIKLVYEALRERGILLRNAPHVVKPLSFIIPCYSYWEKIKYSAGLKFYDLLSGKFSFGKSVFLDKEKIIERFPNIDSKELKGGVQYFDGQFDDARLAIDIARSAADQGATVINYFKVISLIKSGNKIAGATARDILSDKIYEISANVVINATGVFVDEILKMEDENKKPVVTTSQGVHIVTDKKFLQSSDALMIPKTADGRVLFALPWKGQLLIGTTDTLVSHTDSLEPRPLQQEIVFLLDSLAGILRNPPKQQDVLSVFAGLRPLAASSDHQSTKEISRNHKLMVGKSGLVTITGGKWTTYRKMAEETVNAAAAVAALAPQKCTTGNIRLHGYSTQPSDSHLSVYGADEEHIKALIERQPSLLARLDASYPFTEAEIVWAVRAEMAMTVEDALARRTRLLFLDARAAMRAAPRVAEIMMKELHLNEEWKQQQVQAFNRLAEKYLLTNEANGKIYPGP